MSDQASPERTRSSESSHSHNSTKSKSSSEEEIKCLRLQFQTLMWQQNEIAEKRLLEMKREAELREEKLLRELRELRQSKQHHAHASHRGRSHRKRRSHHRQDDQSSRHTLRTKHDHDHAKADVNDIRDRQVVGKLDIYIHQTPSHLPHRNRSYSDKQSSRKVRFHELDSEAESRKVVTKIRLSDRHSKKRT